MDFSRLKDKLRPLPPRPPRSPTGKSPLPPSRSSSPTKIDNVTKFGDNFNSVTNSVTTSCPTSMPSSVNSTPKKWPWFSTHFFRKYQNQSSGSSSNLYNYNNVLLTKIIPISGSLSYSAFAFHIHHPRAIAFLLPKTNVPIITNCLLFNSHLGVGLYLYSRSHMSRSDVPIYKRIIWSIFGSLIFNFGSILFWATTKNLLPDQKIIKTLIAISSATVLLIIGTDYLAYVDKMADKTADTDLDDEEEDDLVDDDDEDDIRYKHFR